MRSTKAVERIIRPLATYFARGCFDILRWFFDILRCLTPNCAEPPSQRPSAGS
jgi:hypothetical protein